MTPSPRSVIIDRRFNGPPDSANGGYACGVVAEGVTGTASVRLRMPPPLDDPLTLETDGESSRLTRGGDLIGEGRSASLDIDAPESPTMDEARQAVRRFVGFEHHRFDTCYVCGTKRPEDGLQIYPGMLRDRGVVASPWTPDESLLDADGEVDKRHVWAALDCPSYFGIPGSPGALLGELTAEIHRLPQVAQPLIAWGWHDHSDGRKHFSGSALSTDQGEIIARAAAVWVEPRQEPSS